MTRVKEFDFCFYFYFYFYFYFGQTHSDHGFPSHALVRYSSTPINL